MHEPGTGSNHAIFEVKSINGQADGTIKDLGTLCRFRHEFGYERAIYLIYGATPAGRLTGQLPCCLACSIWARSPAITCCATGDASLPVLAAFSKVENWSTQYC